MRGTGASRYRGVLPDIMWANREGFRLVVPSCFRVPLAAERVTTTVPRADRSEQPNREGLAPRPAIGFSSSTVDSGVQRSP